MNPELNPELHPSPAAAHLQQRGRARVGGPPLGQHAAEVDGVGHKLFRHVGQCALHAPAEAVALPQAQLVKQQLQPALRQQLLFLLAAPFPAM